MAAYVVLTTRPAPLAPVVAGALAAEGLDVRTERDGFGAVYGLTAGSFATTIYVAADDYEAARALLDEIEADPLT